MPWNPDHSLSPLDGWLAQRCTGVAHMGLPAALRQAQTERLHATLAHAASHSPFYRARLGGAHKVNLGSLDNLASLPFTSADDLQHWQDMLCVSQSDIARIVSLNTSGTSGPPKRIAFSEHDLEQTKDFFRVGMSQLVQPGDRALVLWPGAKRPLGVGALLTEALEGLNVRVFCGEPLSTPQSLHHELMLFMPHVLVAAPRQLAVLTSLLESTGSLSGYAPRGILSSAERLPADLAQHLHDTCTVLDHYGLTESGYGGGVECLAHDGYHLRELDMLVEVVDIMTGQVLDYGSVGEVVITTLGREAMPLIRYRTGDAATVLPGPCACGSPLRRLGPVLGRIEHHGATYSINDLRKGQFYDRTAGASL